MGNSCPKCKTENPSDSKFCKECATPLHGVMNATFTKTIETQREDLTTGSTFANRYQIIEELGQGGMGTVYKVLDTETKERIALKLIKPEIASDKKTIERFRNELITARKISHKNVCRMFDLNKDNNTYYITMEYVNGGDLKKFIRRAKRLDTGTAVAIAGQICSGLGEAHSLGIVHRDLKPNNIMIDENGNAKIMDFGIARTQKEKGVTGSGMVVGTPDYMSPEQAEAKAVDGRSDIYSLGVILYEMITGRLPFEGETPLAVAMKHKGESPKDPKVFNPGMPEGLSRVILRCLAKDKEDRYQDAEEVRRALDGIEKGLPAEDRFVPKRKPITSREITLTFGLKKLIIPIAALVFIAALLILWAPWKSEKISPLPSGKPSIAVPYFENNTGDTQLDYLKRGLSEWIITDLGQSKFIDVTTGDRMYSVLNALGLADAEKYAREDLVAIAGKAGVNHILTGGFMQIGEHVIITLTVHNLQSGETVSSIEKRSRGLSGIPPIIDEITRELKSLLNLTEEQIAMDLDKRIGEMTTSSPISYRHFIKGVDHQIKAEYYDAIRAFEKAVDADPEFALAYRFLSQAYINVELIDESKTNLQKAFELRDRLPDRERYQVEASYYFDYSYLTKARAIESLKKKIALYPDDWLGNVLLGLWYMDFEEWDKAIEAGESALLKKDPTWWPFFHITSSYTAIGLYDKALKNMLYCRENIGDNYRVAQTLTDLYLCMGRYDLALRENDHTLSYSPPDLGHYKMFRTLLFILENRTAEAENLSSTMLGSESPIEMLEGIKGLYAARFSRGRFQGCMAQKDDFIKLIEEKGDPSWLCDILLGQAYARLRTGAWEKALQEADGALERAHEVGLFRPVIHALTIKGQASIKMEDFSGATGIVEEIEALVEKTVYKKHSRFAENLKGLIKKEQGQWEEAIDHFHKALDRQHFQKTRRMNDHALFLEPLADTYFLKGDLDRAIEEYTRIIGLTMGRAYYGDIYARAFYNLGRINERQGESAQAIKNYQIFLDLWKDADPGLAEVEEAEKRLDGLRNQ